MTPREFLIKKGFKTGYIETYKITEQGLCDFMKDYAELSCKKQRDICQDIYDLSDAIIGDVFRNAPEPKFD